MLDRLKDAPKGKLVVVTGVNPTQFGEGKTTTLLGLVQALNVRLGKLAFGTLRQPSQGPTFGIVKKKNMKRLNGGKKEKNSSLCFVVERRCRWWRLFSSDSHVRCELAFDWRHSCRHCCKRKIWPFFSVLIFFLKKANNLLCAAVDARILHEGSQKTGPLFRRLVPKKFAPVQLEYLKKLGINKTNPKDLTPEEQERFSRLDIDPNTIQIKRVLDCNDRFLRDIRIGLGSGEKGFERNTGFDIAVASEVMAIMALAKDATDLKARLNRIVVGQSKRGDPVTVGDVGVGGAMAALMNDAIMPNLLQSLEGERDKKLFYFFFLFIWFLIHD